MKKSVLINPIFFSIFKNHKSKLNSKIINETQIKKTKKKVTELPFKTTKRNTLLIPLHVGSIFNVYNGIQYLKVHVHENIVGHKLGEFSICHKRYFYKKGKVTHKGKVIQKSNVKQKAKK